MNGDSYPPLVESLTEREKEILHLISKGFSNRDVARELVLTSGTIKWYNRQIYRKLGVHSRTQAVARAKKTGIFEGVPKTSPGQGITPRHNLPAQITSFVGRDREIEEIRGLLRTARLLTLTGPGGSGKTRLALQAAANAIEQFDDGIFFIDLAPIRDARLVPSTIAHTLDILEVAGQSLNQTLKHYFIQKNLLLLLDNFEQIIGAASLVAELLSASAGLKVLVTSREALQIYGEQEYPVPPLSIPDLDRHEPLRILSQNESVELFHQRAKAVKPGFRITGENARTIAEICVRLDGLPLAIELAAARSKLLSPEMIRSRLENRLATLSSGPRDAPSRLQTLRGTLDWSYELLEGEEKALFARLSVFQGGRTVESTELVCGTGLTSDVLDGLESLLNKNLLFHEEGTQGEPRFFMLETIHEYAREKLDESGETDDLHKRHADYFARLVSQAEREQHSARQGYWFARLRAEHDNLRAALAWSLDGADIAVGSLIVGALREFWYAKGHISEGLRWSDLALKKTAGVHSPVRAKVLNSAGNLAFAKGDYRAGVHFHREALALSQELGDDINRAWAMVLLGNMLGSFPDDIEEAVALCEEGLALFDELDYIPGKTKALNGLGELARMVGDYQRAKSFYEECVKLCRQTGDKYRQAIATGNLSSVAMHQGEYDQAESLLVEALTLIKELKLGYFIGLGIALLAGPVTAKGQPERAARLVGASEAILQMLGVGQQPADQIEIDRYVTAIRQQLDEETYKEAFAKGRAMSLEEAVAYALD